MVLSKIDHIPTPSDAHGIYFVYNPNNVSITGIYVHAEDGTVRCLGNPSLWEVGTDNLIQPKEGKHISSTIISTP